MKSVLKNIVTIILLNVPLLSFTQNDKLIIGIETDSIYTNDFDDIILSPYPGSDSFYLDIDNNNEWDLHFTINESSGGTYGGAWINLYSNDSTMFSLDTLATQWIGNSNDLILDTTSEVKIFSIGDTLSITEHLSNSNYFTNVYLSWNGTTTYYSNNLRNWVAGTHYVGFQKIIENRTILGWVKVEIPELTKICLKEFAINTFIDTLPQIRINEYMTANFGVISDEYGEFDDWIELYNISPDSVFLGELYLTNNLSYQYKWKMPNKYMQPYEYILIWADNQIDQGPFHANFMLSFDGGEIGIFKKVSGMEVDSHVFWEQTQDFTEGRLPDGFGDWQLLAPTPLESNQLTYLNENEKPGRYIIYPNPTNGSIVKLSSYIDFVVYNIFGQIVDEGKITNEINVTEYKKGVYFIKLKGSVTKKLIIN